MLAPEICAFDYFDQIGANPAAAKTHIEDGQILRACHLRCHQKAYDGDGDADPLDHRTLLH